MSLSDFWTFSQEQMPNLCLRTIEAVKIPSKFKAFITTVNYCRSSSKQVSILCLFLRVILAVKIPFQLQTFIIDGKKTCNLLSPRYAYQQGLPALQTINRCPFIAFGKLLQSKFSPQNLAFVTTGKTNFYMQFVVAALQILTGVHLMTKGHCRSTIFFYSSRLLYQNHRSHELFSESRLVFQRQYCRVTICVERLSVTLWIGTSKCLGSNKK